MTAHTAAASATDTRYYISANLPATYDAAGYADTDLIWAEIGRVQDFPPSGSKRNVNKFMPIYGPVEKSKGAPDYGDGDLICADVPADPGQIIVKAAEASANHYSMKAVYPDAETHYFDVLVTGWQLQPQKEGAFLLRTGGLSFCKAPVIVAAT